LLGCVRITAEPQEYRSEIGDVEHRNALLLPGVFSRHSEKPYDPARSRHSVILFCNSEESLANIFDDVGIEQHWSANGQER
jgi:hypothetical protein